MPLRSLRARAASDVHRVRATASMNFLEYGEGRVAIVTGASRGLGRAVAERLGGTGVAHVVCVARTAEGCKDVVDAITAKGGSASAEGCDVADVAAVKDLCEKVLKEQGRVDILVNNAGITKDGLFMRMSDDDWLDVINTNLNSVFYFTKPVIRAMAKQRFGRIINMSSVVGVGGNPGQANYAAAKAGVIGFSKALAKEMAGRGVTVNAVAPGYIATDMTDALSDDVKEKVTAQVPAGRMGTPTEVADLVAFLSSENAGYINGHVIPVDGALLFGYP
ncbi:unnamed protein product [Vitrella brassicaformis CCMP3155]|uniref:3-oxoacyl-[acyl-carrier-protein] reductase n=1 Tax=Vitrella brassicaformis (strain CCMP3155) TaxID=1169540 RepID=A0A0G4H653_VITBC|nr:unnamed protein product [Vitrella brassicaformis CCMP3155]|eukprot:CEM39310.1 unnamed protein product [Vitrella brassicaformis CCMP3155]